MRGLYFYDKYRKPLSLSGKQTEAGLELTESSGETEQATISLTPTAAGMTGRWLGHGKQLPIALRYGLKPPAP